MNRPAPEIPDGQRARQAVASLGGYAHQLIVTLLAWMELGDGDTLLVEVAEDYAVLGSGALDMTQVKRETTGAPLTLRRPDARKAILSLWQFGEANPDLRISLHFLTTAPSGHERGAAFPGGATGVDYWARAVIGQDVSPVRAYLLELEWPDDLATFLAEADDESLRARLLRPLVWTTGADQTRTALDVLSDRLALRAIADDLMPSDGERALPLLLLDLLRLVLEEDRRVDRLAFERAWEMATTVPMPLSAVRQMRGAAPPTLPDFSELSPDPLPRRHSTRREAVDQLAAICGSGAVPWIHGSSGLGKSRLATLLAAKLGGAWHFVRMRGMSPAETAATLRKAVAGLTKQGLVGVVLDDLRVPTAGAWERHLRSLTTETARLKLHLVVTSERRPLTTAGDEFDPWRVEAAPASYLTVDETAEIVAAAGGDPGQWASILHLTCGGGHPLFVDARGVRVGLLCDAAVEFGAAGDWTAALGQLGEVHLAAEALPANPSERSWLAIQAVSQVAQWLKARHEGRTALPLEEHPGTWSLLEPTLPDDRTGAVGLDTALSMAALLEVRLGRGELLTRRFEERELQGKVTPLSSIALRGGQLAALVDRRDVQAFVALLPTFVAAGQAALQAKADGSLHFPTTIRGVPAAEWNDAGRMAAHQAMSELLAETILDRDPVALESTRAQIEPIERDLDNVQNSETDYVTTALDGLAWLASPGHADPASLVHVGIHLTNWLTVCTRPSLSARVWRELRNAWEDVCRLAPLERGAPALGDLPTLVALQEGGMPEVARLTLAGAEVLGLPLHPSTATMLDARAGRQ